MWLLWAVRQRVREAGLWYAVRLYSNSAVHRCLREDCPYVPSQAWGAPYARQFGLSRCGGKKGCAKGTVQEETFGERTSFGVWKGAA